MEHRAARVQMSSKRRLYWILLTLHWVIKTETDEDEANMETNR